MYQVPPSSSKGLSFDFKEPEDSPIHAFINNWVAPSTEPVEMTLDLAAIAAAMKPKINNNWSRKRKNEVSKPARRKVREIRNFIVDKIITDIQITSESTVDSFVMDATVTFDLLDNPPEPNQKLKDLMKRRTNFKDRKDDDQPN